MLGPIVAGSRVRLEPPRPEFFATYLRWFADPAITRYLVQRHPPSLRQEEAWYERMAESRDDVVWAIVLATNGLPIGGHRAASHRLAQPSRLQRDPARRAVRVGQGLRGGGDPAADGVRVS